MLKVQGHTYMSHFLITETVRNSREFCKALIAHMGRQNPSASKQAAKKRNST